MKICLIGDSHSKHSKLVVPKCDLLIHSGDWTMEGTEEEVRDFGRWLDSLDQVGDIALTPGNHERYFERELPESKLWLLEECPFANLVIHDSFEFKGIKFFLSPYTPAFGFGWAYNAARTPVESAHIFKPFIGDLWAEIPEDINILVTHGMPYGILDDALDYHLGKITSVGDRELLKHCQELPNLKHVVGGHLHAQGSKSQLVDGVWYHNCAVLDDNYQLKNKPILIEY